MANIGNPLAVKTSPKFNFGEMLAVGLVKTGTERALARVPGVGNGTLRSGGIKVLLALGAYSAANRTSGFVSNGLNVGSTALTIDGVEDLVTAGVRMWNARQNSMSTQTINAQVI